MICSGDRCATTTWSTVVVTVGVALLFVAVSTGTTVPGRATEAAPPVQSTARHVASTNLVIGAEAATADIGVPYPMNASVTGIGFLGASFSWRDTLGEVGTGATFSLDASAEENVSVTVTARSVGGLVLQATRFVQVVNDPSVNLTNEPPAMDLGTPVPLTLRMNGGTPPFQVSWSEAPSPPGNQTLLNQDGPLAITIIPRSAGQLLLSVVVTDEWSEGADTTFDVGWVGTSLRWDLPQARVTSEVGQRVAITGYLDGGTVPITWGSLVSPDAWNALGNGGTLAADGAVQWQGAFGAPGNATVALWARDSAGAVASSNATVSVIPALAATLLIPRTDPVNATEGVLAEVLGGAAPIEYRWLVDGTPVGNGTLPPIGQITLFLPLSAAENRTVELTLVDALGVQTNATATLLPQSPPTGPSSSPLPVESSASGGFSLLDIGEATAAGAGLAGLVVGLWAWSRRRGSGDTTRPSDASDRIVRRIIEESAGIDNATLESLAAEEGISPGRVAESVARWRQSGYLREEPGWEGGRILRWAPEGQSTPEPPRPGKVA